MRKALLLSVLACTAVSPAAAGPPRPVLPNATSYIVLIHVGLKCQKDEGIKSIVAQLAGRGYTVNEPDGAASTAPASGVVYSADSDLPVAQDVATTANDAMAGSDLKDKTALAVRQQRDTTQQQASGKPPSYITVWLCTSKP